MKNILVIGGGSWGTCLSKLLVENGHKVYLWEHNEEVRKVIRDTKENPKFLPNIKLPDSLNVVDDYGEILKNPKKYEKIDILLLATPTQFLRNILKRLKNFLNYNIILVNVAKGLEITTKKRISEIVAEELENKEYSYVLLAGPTHAEEVAQKLPSAILSVSKDEEAAKIVQTTFSNLYFRVYTGTDLMGAELAGALKNCLAIAAGIADGMGYGDNTKAALITRGIKEIATLGIAMGGEQSTFYGLTGLGDLIVTCASMHSRNRRAGILLGQGKTLDEAIKEVNMVVEGVYSAKSALMAAKKYNVEIPIIEQVNAVLFENKNAAEAVNELMIRDKKLEIQSW